ncbi:MAG: FAD:protein FMN transferase [Halieaceae bacterium]|jgi:thiamine biosynthesis lipoprotein|nr:FAD:protein FMN transferase [Halieaceae bacterium]
MPRVAPLRLAAYALCATAALLLSACDRTPTRIALSGATMGTTWSAVYAGASGLAAGDAQALIEGELRAINDALSTYIAESEISRLNAIAGVADVQLSERFAEVLDSALEWSALTQGAYDVTVGPLVELWGFGSTDFRGAVPDQDEIDAALAVVGAPKLSWNAQQRRLQRPAGMRLDLSSIAKGYAVDRLSRLLADRGADSSLVEIGGELRARGERPEGGPWRVAVESPDPSERRFVDALSISDASVATSGDYRNFFEVGGRRYSHLVDPRTGYPVDHELVSVTVIHEDCMVADALATGLIVMGLDAARALAEAQGLAAQFVTAGSEGLDVHYTEGFAVYREQAER